MSDSKPPIAAIAIRVIIVGLGLAFFFEQAGARQLLHLDGAGEGVMTGPAYWVSLVGPIFFLAALWTASNALARMNRKEAFGPEMVRWLKEMGGCLMLGAFAVIVLQPSLIYLIDNGWTEMRGVRFDWSMENITIALVGLVLILVAREGGALKTKLDEFV